MVYYYEGINIARRKQRSVINQKGTHGYLLNDLTQPAFNLDGHNCNDGAPCCDHDSYVIATLLAITIYDDLSLGGWPIIY